MANDAETLAFAFVLGILVVFIVLWGFAIGLLKRGEPILAQERRPSAPWGLVDLGLVVVAAVAVQIGAMRWVSAELNIEWPDQGFDNWNANVFRCQTIFKDSEANWIPN